MDTRGAWSLKDRPRDPFSAGKFQIYLTYPGQTETNPSSRALLESGCSFSQEWRCTGQGLAAHASAMGSGGGCCCLCFRVCG